jgi:iron-sulfur cluster assembly accessory protein
MDSPSTDTPTEPTDGPREAAPDAPEFAFTEAAAKKIASLIADQEPKAIGLRVGVRGGGCSGLSYFMDVAPAGSIKEKDLVFERDGAKVIVDHRSIKFLRGTELDWVSNLMGESFKFVNPNVKKSCGCGSSFSV